jgi:diacylglycerol kinase family enzyme
VPVSVLPGGSTNVVCRTLGIPNDVVDATEHLLALVDEWAPRKVDLGRADGRHFVFSCGVGIDATVVKRVDAHPKLKSRAGPYYYSWAAVSAFYRSYLHKAIRLRVETSSGETAEGVTALAQNSDPFTYFASRPVRVCEGVSIDDGTLALGVLKRAAQRDMPTLIARLFSESKPAARHRQIEHFTGVAEATVTSISETKDGIVRPFPIQVDGDYIGEKTEVTLRAEPGALTVIS